MATVKNCAHFHADVINRHADVINRHPSLPPGTINHSPPPPPILSLGKSHHSPPPLLPAMTNHSHPQLPAKTNHSPPLIPSGKNGVLLPLKSYHNNGAKFRNDQLALTQCIGRGATSGKLKPSLEIGIVIFDKSSFPLRGSIRPIDSASASTTRIKKTRPYTRHKSLLVGKSITAKALRTNRPTDRRTDGPTDGQALL